MTYNEIDFFRDWESHWGKMDKKWIKDFLSHDSLPIILSYDPKLVKYAITRARKLESIAKYLKNRVEIKDSSVTTPKPGSMQQATNVVFKARMNEPGLPSEDWWREQG